MNRCIFLGNLTRDPELRATPTGKAVVQFALAINRKSSADREEVLFVECEAWEKRAEAIAKYFAKGRQILVEGHLRQENWEDKQTGQKRSRVKLVVEAFHFTGRKDDAPAPRATDDPAAPYGALPPGVPEPKFTNDEDVPF